VRGVGDFGDELAVEVFAEDAVCHFGRMKCGRGKIGETGLEGRVELIGKVRGRWLLRVWEMSLVIGDDGDDFGNRQDTREELIALYLEGGTFGKAQLLKSLLDVVVNDHL
jgi:hypothetical protein